jgi:LmbE family N-acetylglucosaminyl deacetylase
VTSDLYGDLRGTPPPLDTPGRAMAIGAHPDDIEFGAGGTLARWAADGCHVTMLVVTDGSKGTWDPDVSPKELAGRRRTEQAAAAAALGAAEVIHLGHIDGELEVSMALREELCRQIRLARPDVLLTHDPWQRYQLHPDHRATGTAALDGVVAARDPLFFPGQGLAPHRPAAALLWSADAPDHAEPIAGTIEAKIEALLCHSSQGTTTMGDAHAGEGQRAAFAARIREWATSSGEAVGHEMAERFKRLTP